MKIDNSVNVYLHELKSSENGTWKFVDDLLANRSEAIELFAMAIRLVAKADQPDATLEQSLVRAILIVEITSSNATTPTELAKSVFNKLASGISRDQLQEYIDIIMDMFASIL